MTKSLDAMKENPVYQHMNQSLCYALDEHGDLNMSLLVKEGYLFGGGGSLETLRDYAFRINEIWEGRARFMLEREHN